MTSQPPTFTTLPPEIRLLIYDHLFTQNSISITASIAHGIQLSQFHIPWQIFATSKRIHQEALTRFKIRLTLTLPPQYRESLVRSYTREISHRLSSHLHQSVTTLSLEGGVTGASLTPLTLFPNLQILHLRSTPQPNRLKAPTTNDSPACSSLPRITFHDLLLAHAETGYQNTRITNIARTLLADLILQHNPRLTDPTRPIRTVFWHTTKFHVDNGETYIRPMIEFVYDSSRDTVSGVHLWRTRIWTSQAECSTSTQIACAICEFRAKMGEPAVSSSARSRVGRSGG